MTKASITQKIFVLRTLTHNLSYTFSDYTETDFKKSINDNSFEFKAITKQGDPVSVRLVFCEYHADLITYDDECATKTTKEIDLYREAWASNARDVIKTFCKDYA